MKEEIKKLQSRVKLSETLRHQTEVQQEEMLHDLRWQLKVTKQKLAAAELVQQNVDVDLICVVGVSFFCIASYRPANDPKRPGIVGRMEKLGRRRKPEVRGGFSHHLATSNVQQSHQRQSRPEQGRAGRIPSGTFYNTKYQVALFITRKIFRKFSPN